MQLPRVSTLLPSCFVLGRDYFRRNRDRGGEADHKSEAFMLGLPVARPRKTYVRITGHPGSASCLVYARTGGNTPAAEWPDLHAEYFTSTVD